MRAFHYATALHSLLALHPEKEDELITQFMSTVRANGHEHLLIKILRSFEKIEKKILTASTIEVTSVVKMSTEEVTKLLRTEHPTVYFVFTNDRNRGNVCSILTAIFSRAVINP